MRAMFLPLILVAVTSCENGDEVTTESIVAQADNQAAALEEQANLLEAQAENATGALEARLENQSQAIADQAEATRAAGQNQANGITNSN